MLYLPFDGAPTKGVIKDQSEYGNHGKLIGKAKWTKNGKFGGSMEFDGAFMIEVPHAKSLDLKAGHDPSNLVPNKIATKRPVSDL